MRQLRVGGVIAS